jgi:DNA-binding MarR family transcriptional regulator
LRRFLAFSEAEAAALGLPSQQHQALLAIAGWTDGEPTIGALAKRLLIAPHTAAELVTRMTRDGLLIKRASTMDRRKTELTLTRKASALLSRLTSVHLQELRTLAPSLISVLGQQRRKR